MQLGKILPASGSLAAFSIFYCVGGAQQPRLVPAHSTTTPPSCARVRIHAHTRAHTRAERHTRLADMKRLVNVIDLGLTTLAFTVAILAQGTSWAVAVTQAFLQVDISIRQACCSSNVFICAMCLAKTYKTSFEATLLPVLESLLCSTTLPIHRRT